MPDLPGSDGNCPFSARCPASGNDSCQSLLVHQCLSCALCQACIACIGTEGFDGPLLQVLGLSAGMFLGTICNSLIYAVMCIRTDWERAVTEALERTGKSGDEQKHLLEENDEEHARPESS